MGSNMQCQAVPLLTTDSPIVGTGIEHKIAKDSGSAVLTKEDGVVEKVAADQIVIKVTAVSDIHTNLLSLHVQTKAVVSTTDLSLKRAKELRETT